MRVVIYGRVSTSDKGQEVDNQLIKLREYARANSWEITKEYVDRKSGATGERVEFKNMYQAASKREFDVVLFWSLDRFSREGVSRTMRYLDILKGYKVHFRSLQESYIDSLGPFGEVVIALLAYVAEFERKRFGERVKAGLDRKRLRGEPIGRQLKIFDIEKVLALKNGGMSLRNIANHLGLKKSTVQDRLKRYSLR
jgi:DNA invertase Pin-like site-specific DNA recombinase